MCTAGDLGKVRGGGEQDRSKEGWRGPPHPRQREPRLTKRKNKKNKRRAFVSLNSCVVPYISLELIDVLFLCV